MPSPKVALSTIKLEQDEAHHHCFLLLCLTSSYVYTYSSRMNPYIFSR